MLFKTILTSIVALSKPIENGSPISAMGGIYFYENECPPAIFPLPKVVELPFNTKIQVDSQTKLKSFIWSYPDVVNLEFYDGNDVKYAVIEGPSEVLYMRMYCGFDEQSGLVKTPVLSGYEGKGIFVSENSYMMVVPKTTKLPQ